MAIIVLMLTVQGYLRAAKCHLMLGNPSLSIDYYNKVLQVETKNKQALQELRVSQSVFKDLGDATVAMERKQYRKVIISSVNSNV